MLLAIKNNSISTTFFGISRNPQFKKYLEFLYILWRIKIKLFIKHVIVTACKRREGNGEKWRLKCNTSLDAWGTVK